MECDKAESGEGCVMATTISIASIILIAAVICGCLAARNSGDMNRDDAFWSGHGDSWLGP